MASKKYLFHFLFWIKFLVSIFRDRQSRKLVGGTLGPNCVSLTTSEGAWQDFARSILKFFDFSKMVTKSRYNLSITISLQNKVETTKCLQSFFEIFFFWVIFDDQHRCSVLGEVPYYNWVPLTVRSGAWQENTAFILNFFHFEKVFKIEFPPAGLFSGLLCTLKNICPIFFCK